MSAEEAIPDTTIEDMQMQEDEQDYIDDMSNYDESESSYEEEETMDSNEDLNQ